MKIISQVITNAKTPWPAERRMDYERRCAILRLRGHAKR